MTRHPIDIEDPQALTQYLRDEGHIPADEQPEIEQLMGGVSNRTVLVERPDGTSWVIKQALEKLRVQVDWFSDPRRIHCEALALRWLTRLTPNGSVPELIFEDHTRHIVAMQAIPQPHRNWKTDLLLGKLELEHVIAFGRLLGTIHGKAFAYREAIEHDFAPYPFFESLRIEPYYRYTAEQVPDSASFYHALIEGSLPRKITLAHGDYSPKNVLIYQDRLILLDHEVAHLGDPAFDVGFSATHLLSKAHYLPEQREAFAQAGQIYWNTYRELVMDFDWFDDLEARCVGHTLACLLARVAGRSPLEYLSQPARRHQQGIVLALMKSPPETMPDLITEFTARL